MRQPLLFDRGTRLRGVSDLHHGTSSAPLKRTDIPPAAGAGKPTGHRPAKHSDAVVLEVRRLREQEGMKSASIVARLQAKGVAINESDVKRYACYQSRGALVPDEGADPYL